MDGSYIDGAYNGGMENKIEYQQVNEALRRLSLTMDGAELQGIFCGRISSGGGLDESRWLAELIGERDEANLQAREDVTLIAQLLGSVVRQLNDADLQFQPLLPEEGSLAARTEALAAWCEGFLYGYGVAVAESGGDKQGVQQEFLQDLVSISQARFGEAEESEEDEMDFLQIVEHVRMGALLLHEENRPATMPATDSVH